MKKILCFVLIISFVFLFSCSDYIIDDEIKETDVIYVRPEYELDVVYKGLAVHSRNPEYNVIKSLDIYYPTNNIYEKSPLLVGFHGGAWIAGDKSQIPYLFSPTIYELRNNGYTVVTVQYRYAQESIFPAQIIDCLDAIKYLCDNAEKYNIDENSVGVMGYSAGAQLAMLAAYSDYGDINIKYCMSFAGPTKFYGDELNEYPRQLRYIIEYLFDGSYEENPAIYELGSPYYYIDRDENKIKKVPLLFVHDENDDTVPFTQSQIMYDKAIEVGIDCEFLKLYGFGHQIDLNSSYITSEESEKINKKILDFIYKYSGK